MPRKNFADLAGHPLLAHSIIAGIEGDLEVALSSEDDEILEVGAEYGAQVIRRPAELAVDTAASDPALVHAAGQLGLEKEDVVLLAQPTSPLRAKGLVSRVARAVIPGRGSLTVASFDRFVWEADGDAVVASYSLCQRPRRQDDAFSSEVTKVVETGSLYGTTVGDLQLSGSRTTQRAIPIKTTWLEAVEIDTRDELEIVRAIADLHPELVVTRRRQAAHLHGLTHVLVDVDGTLTDGTMIYDGSESCRTGSETKAFHTYDGIGIHALRLLGIEVLFITSEFSTAATARAAKLGVEVRLGIRNKDRVVEEIRIRTPGALVAFIGDDWPDVAGMRASDVSFAVATATPDVRALAHVVLKTPGGNGVVREVAELVARSRGTSITELLDADDIRRREA